MRFAIRYVSLFILLILILLISGCANTNDTTETANGVNEGTDTGITDNMNIENGNSAGENTFETKSTGSTNPGSILIEVTPIEVANGVFKARIAANTHSVDLSAFDLKELTILEINGNKYKPVSVPQLTSHHGSGEIVFNIDEPADVFTIVISGIPDVEERTFNWQ